LFQSSFVFFFYLLTTCLLCFRVCLLHKHSEYLVLRPSFMPFSGPPSFHINSYFHDICRAIYTLLASFALLRNLLHLVLCNIILSYYCFSSVVYFSDICLCRSVLLDMCVCVQNVCI
jgi:hypothetical protein